MIGIIGLGYVGLPLCLQFARKGAKVLGLDIDHVKVDMINAGQSYIHHITAESVQQQVGSQALRASTDFTEIGFPGGFVTWGTRIRSPFPSDDNGC